VIDDQQVCRVEYEFIAQDANMIPTEKCRDKAYQAGVELDRLADEDGDDGSFPYPVRNGGAIIGWASYILRDESPINVVFYNISTDPITEIYNETWEPTFQ
jgi:hypothetical protein